MIIECINCNKKFNVDAELIPEEGRKIQCGSCAIIFGILQTKQNIIKNQ